MDGNFGVSNRPRARALAPSKSSTGADRSCCLCPCLAMRLLVLHHCNSDAIHSLVCIHHPPIAQKWSSLQDRYFFFLIAIFYPFRTTVLFWGQTTWNLSGLPPKQDCSPKRVNPFRCLVLGTSYSKFAWVVPKTGLRF